MPTNETNTSDKRFFRYAGSDDDAYIVARDVEHARRLAQDLEGTAGVADPVELTKCQAALVMVHTENGERSGVRCPLSECAIGDMFVWPWP